jgi:hypothetical protein
LAGILKNIFASIFYKMVYWKKTYNVLIFMFSLSLINLITGDISLNEFLFIDSMTLFLEAKGILALRAGVY